MQAERNDAEDPEDGEEVTEEADELSEAKFAQRNDGKHFAHPEGFLGSHEVKANSNGGGKTSAPITIGK